MTARPEPLLWLGDNRGVYIPRDFALCWADGARDKHVSGVRPEVWAALEDANGDGYWDAWTELCARARVTIDGITYHVWQDGDCWLVPVDMPWSDDLGFFAWPDDVP